MKKVSIIVPVYNAEKFISIGIESVLSQNYKNIELILIDDGSKDKSFEILKEYEKKYPKIIKSFHKDNSGVGDTRNYGIKKSSGEFITFLDADDYLSIDFISTLVNDIGDNDIIISGYNQVDESHKLLFSRNINKDTDSKFRQLVVWAKLYRKKFIINNNLYFNSLKIGEDITYSLTSYMKTDKVKCINYCGYNNVSNDQSVTKNRSLKKDTNILQLIKNLSILCQDTDFIKKNKKQLEYFYLKIFSFFLFDKAKVLNYSELKIYYYEGLNYLKKYYKENNMNFKAKYNRQEPLSVNIAVKLVVISYKLHLEKILLKLLSRKFYEK